MAERPFSGNLSLRLGPELHRELALRTAEAGVSINRYVVGRVA
ncbi:toxin-antitoxin system HicB family antitoxin [uncultured Friedmanniella sp.]